MSPLDVEVVVVGGGVMGLATARALARGGRDVVLVEQFQLGHARGSSHGGSRIFRLSYPAAGWTALACESLPLWRELEAEAGERLLEQHGSLDLGDFEPNRASLEANGVPYEVLAGPEIERRFPLRADSDQQGLFEPNGGIVLADRALAALLASARSAGASVLEETRATGIELDGEGVVIACDGSTLRVGAIVVTAGAWSRALLEPTGIELDVIPTRETVSYFELGTDEPVPSLIDFAEGGKPGQLGYALVAPGVGLKAGIHHTGPETDPDASGEPDARIAEWTAEWVTRRFREAVPAAAPETCIYTNTPDESFVLQHRGRIVVGSACSGHAFKFAPVVGERLAGLVQQVL